MHSALGKKLDEESSPGRERHENKLEKYGIKEGRKERICTRGILHAVEIKRSIETTRIELNELDFRNCAHGRELTANSFGRISALL